MYTNILTPVIEYYLGFNIDHVEFKNSMLSFCSRCGNGELKENEIGNWDLILDRIKVSEIENSVLEILIGSETMDLEKYYNDLKELEKSLFNYRSLCLVKDILASIEYFLVNHNVKIKKPIRINDKFIFSLDGENEIIYLN